ncbi:MAG TPA: tripartite tricarboxylate transporter substrate-binding protein [Ramlibacter sp.]|nr:tripartite tricarboxylate transporter substrate-binding protein [Ramlibacter sp.]
MKRSTLIKLASLMAVGGVFSSPVARAQSPADRPLTLVVPFPAGTPADILARALADEIQVSSKRTVVVDNRAGASQLVGASYVASSAPDGNTLLMLLEPAVFSASALKAQPFASVTDFEAVAHVASVPNFLAVAPGLPVSNLKEFIALLKANPGKYNFGSAGTGSAGHLFLEMLNKEAGIKAVHVPYKSFLQALTDTMSGEVSYLFSPLSSMQFVKQGKLKAMAIAAPVRDPDHPGLVTFDESGLKGIDAILQYMIVAPKGTPAAAVNRVNAAINGALASATFVTKVKAIGGVTIPNAHPPAQARALLAREDQRWKGVVKSQNIDLAQ